MQERRSGAARYCVLGPLAVTTDSGPIRIGSQLQRLLLAVLLVEANRVVAADRLKHELWGDHLPGDPAGALRTQVSRLRKILPPGTPLLTEDGGYRLQVEPDQLDSARFDRLFATAADNQEQRSLQLLDEALDLWRGAVLEEFADRPFAQPEARRLEELHGAAREQRAALLVRAGRDAEAAAAMEALIAEQPERERARALLMEALYHLGRHTEALDTYQSWRSQLAEELGLEPSPALQRIEHQILQHTLADDAPIGRSSSRSDVPRPVSSFVGREGDLRETAALLGEVRLVTLWGPGGVGKTRLALELAAEVSALYPDGVHICDLAVLDRPADVTRAVATGLGVRDKAFRRLETQLLEHLASRRALVVLDNCEHVLAGAAPLAEQIIRSSRAVDVLATSRERLAVDGEHLWEVRPLPVRGSDSPAVGLFVDRARATNPAFEVAGPDREIIADICRQLDGLPLAIELAASRVRGLSLEELYQSLDQRFEILTAGRGTHRRHRSLGAVLDWSYGHLGPVEQKVFDRLAVFSGPFDLEAARTVVSGDGISPDEVTAAVLRLLNCALLVEHAGRGPRRYSLLDTMRRYGFGRLDTSNGVTTARDRHARWAVALAERAGRGLNSAAEADWAHTLCGHLDELRAAHTWLVGRDTEGSVRLAAALRPYALWRGTSEVFRWAEVAAAAAAGTGSPRLAEALLAASTGAWQRGDIDAATAAAQAAANAAPPFDPLATRASLEARADVAFLVGDLMAATTLFTEAYTLAFGEGDLLQAVWDLGSASLAIAYGGDAERAWDAAKEVLSVAERCGSPSARAFAHFVAGEILAADEPQAAEAHLLEAIELARSVDSRFVVGLAEVALAASKVRQQDVATALVYCESAIAEWHRAGAWTPLWVTLRTVIALLVRVGACHDAALLYGASESARVGVPPFGSDAAMMRDAGERIRSELGNRTFGLCVQQGSALSGDEVIALALDALRRAAHQHAPT